MTLFKNNSNNDKNSSIEELLYRRYVAMLICIVLLSIEFTTAQDIPVKIGNPTLAHWPANGNPAYPNNDPNARRRSVWDMIYFNGRIYIGSGDYWDSSGPNDLWTYNGNSFVKEFTVDDECILYFFEYDNKLLIPGIDATEDWSFGNLYINDPYRSPNPGWIKLRTIPNGVKVYCAGIFKGKLYIQYNDLGSSNNLVSNDMGQTWTNFISGGGKFVVFRDFMFIDPGGSFNPNVFSVLFNVFPNVG